MNALTLRELDQVHRERASHNRAARTERRQALLELLRRLPEVYCVDAALKLGWGTRGHSLAKSMLRTLERDGLATSELRASPTGGGPGRRYYRLAEASTP